jgi:signal transduction histidine kinase
LSKPFAQALHPSACGAGLGLAIIDEVARLHGGSLDCDPERREIVLTFVPTDYRAGAMIQELNLD